MTGATGNFYTGLHEFGDMGFLLHFLRSQDLFVDVGANIGSFTVLASGVAQARSISIEPVPSTFARLTRNMDTNHLNGLVTAFCQAAGANRGSIRFSIDRDSVNQAVQEDYQGKSMEVPVVPLDETLRGQAPCLWKIDVEGFELEVLRGASSSLDESNLRAVLLEGDSPEIEIVMKRSGFERSSYNPLNRELKRVSDKTVAGRQSINNLWIRDFDFVAARCSQSRRFKIYDCEF